MVELLWILILFLGFMSVIMRLHEANPSHTRTPHVDEASWKK